MKFLLNMNIPRELGKRLKSKGHKTRHVGDIGMAKASDMAIIEESRKNKETIITHDLDYGNLLAFSGESTPSIILFRVRNTHIDNLFKRIVESWKEIEKSLVKGAIIVIRRHAYSYPRFTNYKREIRITRNKNQNTEIKKDKFYELL